MRQHELQLGKWKFHQIKLDDKTLYNEFIKKTSWPVNLWSSNFSFIWAYSKPRKRKVLWKVIDNMLVTFILTEKGTLSLLCLPFGSGDANELTSVLHKCLQFCSNWTRVRGYKTRVRTINNCQLEYLQNSDAFDKLFKLKKLQGIEHHYSIDQLLTLKGKRYNSIRRTVNKYYREYPDINIRAYQPDDYRNVLAFNKYWEETSGNKYYKLVDYFKNIFTHYKQLDMHILVAELNNEIIGVNAGGELPTGDAWGCICKTKKTIAGLNEAIILQFIRELNRVNNNIQYLNVGSDMGIAGLRRYKKKFHPAFSLEMYRVFRQE